MFCPAVGDLSFGLSTAEEFSFLVRWPDCDFVGDKCVLQSLANMGEQKLLVSVNDRVSAKRIVRRGSI